MLLSSNALAQQQEVTGVVTDARTGETLPGVNILISGTDRGTITNVDGRYSLTVNSTDEILIFSYIGYERLEVTIDNRNVIDVSLNPSTIAFGDELVVVGYGTLRQREVTGSVARLDASVFNQGINLSVEELIQGIAPGVQVVQNTGEPGGGMSMSIRGVGSITGGTSPLYVIDGLPIDNSVLVSGTGNQVAPNRSPRNPLSSLNPSDIESIEILKDAAATAIYGSRGANGVVMITTKSGAAGDLQVSYNGTFGIQNTSNRLNLLNAEQYMVGVNELIDAGMGGESERVASIQDGGTDWQGVIFRDNAMLQSHDLSFSWGSESTTFLVSLNSKMQDGLVRSSGYEGYGARFNLRHNSDRFRIGVNSNVSYIKDEFIPFGFDVNERSGVINAAKLYDPTIRLRDENGEYVVTEFANLDNPDAILTGTHMDANRYRFFGNAFTEYSIMPNIVLRINAGGDINNEGRNVYVDRTTVTGRSLGGIATVYDAIQTNYLLESTLSFTETYNNHSINAVIGTTAQRFVRETSNLQGNNFVTDATRANNMALADRASLTANSSKAANQLLSYFGRVNYTLNDKYIFTGSYRIDGSSRFGSDNRFGYFPSLSVGWLIDQEDFFTPFSETVNMLKLRASWGLTGNQEIGNNQSIITFGSGRPYVLDGNFVNTLNPARIANPDLKWETTEQYNIGMEFSLFDNRISGSVEWFRKNTTDMLINLPVPTSSGYNSRLENIGSMKNQGLEFSLTTHNVNRLNFSWRTDLNIATLKNEVVDIGGLSRILTGAMSDHSNISIIAPGLPIQSFFGYEVEGIWQLNEADEAAQFGSQPGHFKFRDVNGDGVIDADDRVDLGNSIPDLTFGIGNTFNYRAFSLHAFFQGVTGVKMLNGNLMETYFPRVQSVRANKMADPFINRWTPDNPTNAHPSLINPNNQRAQAINSRTVVDASYIKLQTLRLSYTLPQTMISSAEVYLTGQNLWTLSNYDGFDPALNPNGSANFRIDWNGYPSARTYLIGIRLDF